MSKSFRVSVVCTGLVVMMLGLAQVAALELDASRGNTDVVLRQLKALTGTALPDDDGAGVTFNSPSEFHRNFALAGYDRTHNFHIAAVYQLIRTVNGRVRRLTT